MTDRLDARVVEVTDPVTGLQRIRLTKKHQSGVATLAGHPVVQSWTRYLDGGCST